MGEKAMKKEVKLPRFWDECTSQSRKWSIINFIFCGGFVYYLFTKGEFNTSLSDDFQYKFMIYVLPILFIIPVVAFILSFMGKNSVKFTLICGLFVISAIISVGTVGLIIMRTGGHTSSLESLSRNIMAIVSIINILTAIMVIIAKNKLIPNYED